MRRGFAQAPSDRSHRTCNRGRIRLGTTRTPSAGPDIASRPSRTNHRTAPSASRPRRPSTWPPAPDGSTGTASQAARAHPTEDRSSRRTSARSVGISTHGPGARGKTDRRSRRGRSQRTTGYRPLADFAGPLQAGTLARMHPVVGELAPDAVVIALDGTPTHLSSLWAEQPVALIFLRHYG